MCFVPWKKQNSSGWCHLHRGQSFCCSLVFTYFSCSFSLFPSGNRSELYFCTSSGSRKGQRCQKPLSYTTGTTAAGLLFILNTVLINPVKNGTWLIQALTSEARSIFLTEGMIQQVSFAFAWLEECINLTEISCNASLKRGIGAGSDL